MSGGYYGSGGCCLSGPRREVPTRQEAPSRQGESSRQEVPRRMAFGFNSGGSTGWPAAMRWQDASYALTRCICQGIVINCPYGISTNSGWSIDQLLLGFRRKRSYLFNLNPCGNAGDFYIQSQLAKFFTKVAPEGIRGKVCDFGTAILRCPNTRGLQGTHVAGIPKER